MTIAIDIIFGIDLFVNFMSAYYNDDFKLIDDRKTIFKDYFRGMFILDVLAILPFELIINNQQDMNGLLRITKLGRLYKLIRLTRLLRMLKLFKQ